MCFFSTQSCRKDTVKKLQDVLDSYNLIVCVKRPKMMSELKKWKLACQKNDLDLVFPNRNGNPIDATRLLKDFFYPTLEAAKIKKIRFHDLRAYIRQYSDQTKGKYQVYSKSIRPCDTHSNT